MSRGVSKIIKPLNKLSFSQYMPKICMEIQNEVLFMNNKHHPDYTNVFNISGRYYK